MTEDLIRDALDKLRGAVMIVYPMQLPPYDPIRLEFEGKEDLSGTQVRPRLPLEVGAHCCFLQAEKDVLDEETTQLWWAGKEMVRSKKLKDYVGRNEKTKIIAKLQKKGQGAPSREPVFSEEEQKQMMAYAYKKQEELKVCGVMCMQCEKDLAGLEGVG